MTTLFMESGTSATYGLDFYSSIYGTAGSSTECSNFTPRALKFSSLTSGMVTASSANYGLTGRVSFRIAGPDSASNQLTGPSTQSACLFSSGNINGTVASFWVQIVTGSGVLRVYDGAVSGKVGTTVITGKTVPQLVSIVWNVVTSTNFAIKVFLNGVLEISATNADFSIGGNFSVKGIGPHAQFGSTTYGSNTYFWDIYTDNDSSLTDPGDISVTAKLQSKLNTNNFDTLGGSGTNRYDRVGERPLSATNYIQHAATSDVQENFAIQGELEGDSNLCGAQIIARATWAVAKRGYPTVYNDQQNIGLGGLLGSANNKTAGTTLVITLSYIPAVGETVLIAFGMDGATGTVSCTDNASTPNTYVVDVDKAAASPSSSNVRGCIIRAYIASNTSLTTITITHPSVTAKVVLAYGRHGVLQASPLDKTASAVGTTGNASSGATATTTDACEVLFSMVVYESDSNACSVGTGMTPDQEYNNTISATGGSGTASNLTIFAGFAIQTATNTQTGDFTNPSTDWVACIATYKCSGDSSLGTPKIMNNGTEGSALTLTTAAAAYMNIVDGGGYPADPAAVGMRSSNSGADTFMYECGMLIAYIPGPPTHHHHKWGPTFNPVLAQ